MEEKYKIDEIFTKVEEEVEGARKWKNKGVKLHGSTIIPHFSEPIRISEGGFDGSLKSYIDQSNIMYVEGRNFILRSDQQTTNYDLSFGIQNHLDKHLTLTLYKNNFLSFHEDFSDFTDGMEGVTNEHFYFAGDRSIRKITSDEDAKKILRHSFPKDNYSFVFEVSNLSETDLVVRFNDNDQLDEIFERYETRYIRKTGDISSISFMTESVFHFDFGNVSIGTTNYQEMVFKSSNDIVETVGFEDAHDQKQIARKFKLPASMKLPITMNYENKSIDFSKVKLEVGINSTEWLLAPEDINPGFSDFQEYVTELEHTIEVNDEKHEERFDRTDTIITGVNDSLSTHVTNYSNYVRDTAEEHTRTLEIIDNDGEILRSVVTQTAGQYAISANAIDLSGLTTFTDFSKTSSKTFIDGGKILTKSLTAEQINFDNATGVNMDLSGKITATSGSVAGWGISGQKLMSPDTRTGMHSGSVINDPAFWAGGIDPWSNPDWGTQTPFYVTNGGKLYARGAEISGKVSASSGTIGGFRIGSSSIATTSGVTKTIIKTGGDVAIGAGVPSGNGDTDTSGASFQVYHNGQVSASNMHITGRSTFKGNISGASGTFTGSITGATGTFAGNISGQSGSVRGPIYAGYGSIGGSTFTSGNLGFTVNGMVAKNIYNVNSISRLNSSSSIGAVDYGFRVHYNELIATSDKRLKTDITEPDKEIVSEIENVKLFQYRMVDEEKYQFGYIAQDIERALFKSASRTAGTVQEMKDKASSFSMITGTEETDSYRGIQPIQILMIKNQVLEDRLEELTNRLEAIESKIGE